jgi:hypothetical protein
VLGVDLSLRLILGGLSMNDEALAAQTYGIQEMGSLFGSLLNVAEICSLIVVDDSYAANGVDIDEIVLTAQKSPNAFVELIPALSNLEEDETDRVSSIVRQALDGNSDLTKQAWQICRTGACEDATLDAKTMSVLEELIRAIPSDRLIQKSQFSGGEWLQHASLLLQQEKGGVLILIDRDFGREGKSSDYGLTLIANLLKVERESVYCALISHNISPGDELDQWSKLAEEHGIAQHRFVVISKRRLADDQPDFPGFLHLMRLSILCGPLQDLRNRVRDHFTNAIDETRKKLDTWSVFDFDEAVFRSSQKEGIWEGETLLRVMTVFTTQIARTSVFGDQVVRDLIGFAREASLVQIPYDERHQWHSVGRMARAYQHAELYFESEYVNMHHLPLEAGDVFNCGDTGECYVLLAQPCDLMVRGSRGRAHDLKHSRMVPLCLIQDEAANAQGQSYELKEWDDLGKSAFVHFSGVHMVRAVILDLCVTRQDGTATFVADEKLPEAMSDSWQRHMKMVLKQLKNESKMARELTGALENKKLNISKSLRCFARLKTLPYCSNTGKFKATPSDNGFPVNLQRVMRLNAAVTADVLRAFTRYQSRTAFDQSVVTDDLRKRMTTKKMSPLTQSESGTGDVK